MNYHDIVKEDMLNGSGIRTVLFVSGCLHKCKGCHNPQTWASDSGIPFDEDAVEEIREEMRKPYISGLTLSGGDPLYCVNYDTCLELCKQMKKEFPNKNIWLYTGSVWEDIKTLEIMEYLDVVVDGEFKQELKDVKYPYAGSTNQRVIDVRLSLAQDKIVLFQ